MSDDDDDRGHDWPAIVIMILLFIILCFVIKYCAVGGSVDPECQQDYNGCVR